MISVAVAAGAPNAQVVEQASVEVGAHALSC